MFGGPALFSTCTKGFQLDVDMWFCSSSFWRSGTTVCTSGRLEVTVRAYAVHRGKTEGWPWPWPKWDHNRSAVVDYVDFFAHTRGSQLECHENVRQREKKGIILAIFYLCTLGAFLLGRPIVALCYVRTCLPG